MDEDIKGDIYCKSHASKRGLNGPLGLLDK